MKKILILLAALPLLVLGSPAAFATHDTASPAWCDSGSTIKHGTTGDDTAGHSVNSSASWCYDLKAGNDTITNTSGYFDEVLGGGGNDSIDTNNDGYCNNGGAVEGQSGDDNIKGYCGVDYLYGGQGSDTIHAGGGTDSVFGGQMCWENGMWGFAGFDATSQMQADGTWPCSINDGGDNLYGGSGNDWIWDVNSDQHADGVADYIDGGDGNDTCVGGTEDTFVNCETINTIPDV